MCQLTSMPISIFEGALQRPQAPLATNVPGDHFVGWTAAAGRERLCCLMAVINTFNVRGKRIPDHVAFFFLPPLFIFFTQVLLCLT